MADAIDTLFAADSGGNFLVTPNVGLMIWTLIAFGIALYLLQRLAFPRIGEALDKRRRAIEEAIDASERTRVEADTLLQEYRARLREAREQADDIIARARKAAERLQEEQLAQAKESREELMERTRRDIETETRRALEDIRKEVANPTVLATEKLARKSLDDEDHRRLIEEALEEIDFSQLAPAGAASGNGSGGSED
jgi:F-type H+-transporting ATPase subunit b